MAKRISLAEGDHLTCLPRDVERVERVERTRRGNPISVVVSHEEDERLNTKRLSPGTALRAWRAQGPAGFDVSSLLAQARRMLCPRPGRAQEAPTARQ